MKSPSGSSGSACIAIGGAGRYPKHRGLGSRVPITLKTRARRANRRRKLVTSENCQAHVLEYGQTRIASVQLVWHASDSTDCATYRTRASGSEKWMNCTARCLPFRDSLLPRASWDRCFNASIPRMKPPAPVAALRLDLLRKTPTRCRDLPTRYLLLDLKTL
jgi:hypothetical protein